MKIPEKETVWVTICAPDGTPSYAITSGRLRDIYSIWKLLADGSAEKLGESENPRELEEKYIPFMK